MPVSEVVPYTYAEFCRDELRLKKRNFREAEFWGDEVIFESPRVNDFVIRVKTGCDHRKVNEYRRLPLFSEDKIVNLPIDRNMAYVAIVDMLIGGEVYSAVVYRARNFHRDLFKRVWITWLKVLGPPFCPECKTRMEICRRRVNGQTWWGCRSSAMHSDHKPRWAPWDIMLSGEASEFAREMRNERR